MSSLQYDSSSGSLLYESGSGSLMRECCCDDCCEEITTVPSFEAHQTAAGATTATVCFCIDDNTCTEEYEIAWAESGDNGATWGTVQYADIALVTPLYPCTINPVGS